VLAVSSADSGSIGALAPQIESTFHIGNTQIGLLVTISSLVAAAGTLPVGVLVDRYPRVRLLVVAVALWAGATILTGASVSYEMLLFARLALGVVLATAGPAVASLSGDLFPPGERARLYGLVLAGELAGAGAGLLIVGDLAAVVGWRAAFAAMALPSAALAVALHFFLPEPRRGAHGHTSTDGAGESSEPTARVRSLAISRDDVVPDEALVLDEDPTGMRLREAARYVLRIPSNRVLIASSALGYFFFAGMTTFAVLFARGHFSLGQAVVSSLLPVIGVGALAGTLIGGRIADRRIEGGHLGARMGVAGWSFILAAILFVPGLLSGNLMLSLPIFVLAAAFMSAPNPPLDAARLDVTPSRLWGRAEAIRTAVRAVFQAFAPLLFGFVSEEFGGGRVGFGSGVNTSHAAVSHASAHGLQLTFLIMLVPLAASGLLLLARRGRHVTDIATAAESELAIDASEPPDRLSAPPARQAG
jgi:predicted MFS family arabinose efflux permease